MSNRFVQYVDILPGQLTQEQRAKLQQQQNSVLRIYGQLSNQANAENTDTSGTPEDREFRQAQIFIRILSGSPNLAVIGGQSRSSNLQVRNPDFHASIIRLAAEGVEGVNDSVLAGLDKYIKLVTDSFAMGGSQTQRDSRWIVTTIYFWDDMLLDFRVQIRIVSFIISVQMEKIVKQGKNETGGETTLALTFQTKDWVFVSFDVPTAAAASARSFAIEETSSYAEITPHQFAYGPEVGVLKIKDEANH